jgi:hypothetical protein
MEMAWRTASNSVLGLLAAPAAALVILAAMSIQSMQIQEMHGIAEDTLRKWQIGGAIVIVAFGFWLDRRFRSILDARTKLDAYETTEQRRFLIRFRIFAYGSFVGSCLTAFIAHNLRS